MTSHNKKIITRFPPSPTGFLQMGNVRTAIYNYVYAKQHKGEFIFRVEDTDKERSTKEYEIELVENLKWLGLHWDNKEFVRQSERSSVYSHYIQKMIEDGEFDYIFEKPTYDPKDLIWRDETDPQKTATFLKDCQEMLSKASDDIFTDTEKIKAVLWPYATENGKGAVLWPIRFALSGKNKSPDPFTLLSILGKKEGLHRLEHAEKSLLTLSK